MLCRRFVSFLRSLLLAFFGLTATFYLVAQGAKQKSPDSPFAGSDADHVQERAAWFARGRVIQGRASAELRYHAYQSKLRMRGAPAAQAHAASSSANQSAQTPASLLVTWQPLGPVPLASDASGAGLQDYHQVSGRATAVAIDPADPTGNTVFIGGAQGGVWKSTNAANGVANDVTWAPLTDDQATLATGSIAIQPGNSDPAQSVVLVGTGEADNSADSYFGLGILRSADGGNSWTLVETANGGAVSFSGLGGTRMAFSTGSGQTSTVVAAMGTSLEGAIDGALTDNSLPGLYTSSDAGQTWTYDTLFSGGAAQATSATSVVYNDVAGMFFAAVRYHGFYSSPDGLNWTPLANQPGGSLLSTAACPQNFSTACPIYRGEITAVPGRNEMYVWFVSLSSSGQPVDEGIWQSLNGGISWTQIDDSGITNCGDFSGCGVAQGTYNLELLAVPNCPNGAQTCAGNPTDLYAGAINLYKCSLANSPAAVCSAGFLNLTHVYGCSPISALAHVHPDQHALAYMIPTAGTEATADLMYFANDGGIYRALNGFTGLSTESCSGTNAFDDLNQNLGSMTQFVSFSEHPSDPNTLLGGTQGNGSPATGTATTSTSWGNVLAGDGGYNAIDPNTPTTWFASNPDVPPGGLDIQECGAGIECTNGAFSDVVSSSSLGGDDGAFYFPYILDPQSATSLLVGTCRIWRGPRLGGAYSALSLNFDTGGTGICSGSEVNLVRAIAAWGTTDGNGSQVIYATTDGLGPINSGLPAGGNVWVTTSATAVSGNTSTFSNVTNNGPGGSINANEFPISAVAIDTSDLSGKTAYVTVMGFTGGPGHVWQTMNAGASWTDWTGYGGAGPLPDSPVNAVVVDPSAQVVYVGTDVGVFQSSTASPVWGEVGPGSGQAGFLPNVAVTALALFNSGGQKLLRASTYGRGVWQTDLVPDFEIAFSPATLTVFVGQPWIFTGTLTSEGGYNNSVELSCVNNPPNGCVPNPVSVTPTTSGAGFTVSNGIAGSPVGDYEFGVQGAGSDPMNTKNTANLTLHVVSFSLSTPTPASVTVPRGTTSAAVSFQVLAEGSFNQSVTLDPCTFTPAIMGASCIFTPGTTVNGPYPMVPSPCPPWQGCMTASVSVPPTATPGPYTVTLQANTMGAPMPAMATFDMTVELNPDFIIPLITFPDVEEGSTGTSVQFVVSSQDGFNSPVALTCITTFGANSCSLSPASVSSFPSPPVTLTINSPSLLQLMSSCPGWICQVTIQGTSGAKTNQQPVSFTVFGYTLTGPQSLAGTPGAQVAPNLTLTSMNGYAGQINATCDHSALPAAQCSFTPASQITLASGGTASLAANIVIPLSAAAGTYNININTADVSGAPSNSVTIPLSVGVYKLTGPATLSTVPDGTPSAALTLTSVNGYSGQITASCDATALPGTICTLTRPSPITLGSGATVSLSANIDVPESAIPGTYPIVVNSQDANGLATSVTIQMTIAQDYAIQNLSPLTQNIAAGQQATYNLTVAPLGASYSGTITLQCSIFPALQGSCSFTPATVGPLTNSTSAAAVMTVTTQAASGSLRRRADSLTPGRPPAGQGPSRFSAAWLAALGVVLLGRWSRGRGVRLALALGILFFLPSCGGVSTGGGGGGSTGTTIVTYTITVTGTPPSFSQPTGSSVTLLVVQ